MKAVKDDLSMFQKDTQMERLVLPIVQATNENLFSDPILFIVDGLGKCDGMEEPSVEVGRGRRCMSKIICEWSI